MNMLFEREEKRAKEAVGATAPGRPLKCDLGTSGPPLVGKEKKRPVMSTRRHVSTSFGLFDRHKSSPALAMTRTSSSISSSAGDGTPPTAEAAAAAAALSSCDRANATAAVTPVLLPLPPAIPSSSPSRSQSERRSSSSTAMVKKLTRAASRSSEGLRSLVSRNKTLGHVGEEMRKASFGGGDDGLWRRTNLTYGDWIGL